VLRTDLFSLCGGGENCYGTRTCARVNGVSVDGPKYKTSAETVWPLVKPLAPVTPWKFVFGDVVDNWTVIGVVKPKNGG